MGSLNKDIEQDLTRYLEDENIENKTTKDIWQFFKETSTKAVTKHVPQKTIGGKQHVPWINTHIKRLIRRRQRRYNAAKKYKNTKNWALYKAMKELVKKTMNEAHENYILNILNIEDNCETNTKQSLGKKFWKYIKSRKKDNMGISPLKNESGEEVIDSKGKAEILNQQYESVLTDEDLNTIPEQDTKVAPNIERLHITTNGVCMLLEKLDPTKAIGPDLIPTRVLKEAADQVAPFLTYIFNHSLRTGDVPQDWRQANITAIFKKGDRSKAVNYRPVSLNTSICCKIMEHIVYRHIIDHLEIHGILADHQHSFRRQRSCEAQLVNTIEEVARSIDNRQQIYMLILYFSKALIPYHTRDHYRRCTIMALREIFSNGSLGG
jgi:hypothetical protein